MAMRLRDFNFSNLYLEDPVQTSRFRSPETGGRLLPPPAEVLPDLTVLYRAVSLAYQRNPKVMDFAVLHDDLLYRVAVIQDINHNNGVFALRRGPKSVPTFAQCGIHPAIIAQMLTLTSGLILFIGPFSSGKTTAGSAFLSAFVTATGGLGMTLEDPPELPLSGDHGEGRIFQCQVAREDIDQEISNIMRTTFDILLISEIRTPRMAAEVIQNGSAGRLVVSTLHSDSIHAGLARMGMMAAGATGSSDGAMRSSLGLLADSFQVAIEMAQIGTNQWGAVRYLMRDKDVPGKIRNGEFASLQNSIQMQMNRLGQNVVMTK